MGFWNKKRVFITGHTGFKGSWLAFWLHKLKANLTGYALDPPPHHTLFQKLELANCIADLRGDITDLQSLEDAITRSAPEVIIHLAAQPLVRESYRNPVTTFSTNVLGTVNVLEVARKLTSLRCVLVITSDKSYENIEQKHAYAESDRLGGRDPYSASKGCAELVTKAYTASYFSTQRQHLVGVATARAGNIVGGGDWAEDRLIPDAMRAFASGEILNIRSPTSTRPWQHVLDPLAGYLLLCERMWEDPEKFSGGWNFGPEDQGVVTVETVANLLTQCYEGNARWEPTISENELYEANLLNLDISKAKTQLGWTPNWSLDKAVSKTVDWYRHLQEGENMVPFTSDQIDEFEQTMTGC